MPLFCIFSTIMIMWIMVFLVGLYFYVLNVSISIGGVYKKGSQMVWW